MANERCHKLMEIAGPWMEGERLPANEEHVRNCPHCGAVLADLDLIRAAGLRMGEEEIEPPAHLWHRLHAELEAQGMIRHRPEWRERFAGLFSPVPQPALATAFLALLAAGALLLNYQSNYRANEAQWLARTQLASDSVATQLASAAQGSMPAPSSNDSNPAVTASLRQNLAIVDNLIALCEKSVQDDPQNEMTRDYLYGAYQQKAELLATMNDRGVNAQ